MKTKLDITWRNIVVNEDGTGSAEVLQNGIWIKVNTKDLIVWTYDTDPLTFLQAEG